MSKYEPLRAHLLRAQASEVAMTFEDIERVIGAPLPAAAGAHRAWWSNNPSNNVMTKAWLAAGYVTERVDMAARRLVFRRSDAPSPAPDGQTAATRSDPGFLERIRARLAGTVTIAPGVDLTDPTGEAWDAESQ